MAGKRFAWLAVALLLPLVVTSTTDAQPRSEAHEQYAKALWQKLQGAYAAWTLSSEPLDTGCGPLACESAKCYLSSDAAGDPSSLPQGSCVVTEHFGEDEAAPVAVTIQYRAKDGYNPATGDWYWAHYLPDGTVVATVSDKSVHGKRGFVTKEEEGRLWVFRLGSPELADFLKSGDLAKRVIRPAAGPAGMTVMSGDNETIDAYLTAKRGFVTEVAEGRLWVFRAGAAELAAFRKDGELAKHVIRPAAGPLGMTIKGPDAETIDAYLTEKPGFVTRMVDGRLWVFREGAEELAEFQASGEPAKQVIRPGAGPLGMTIKAPDAETIDAYLRVSGG
jgi:hypothetical protein